MPNQKELIVPPKINNKFMPATPPVLMPAILICREVSGSMAEKKSDSGNNEIKLKSKWLNDVSLCENVFDDSVKNITMPK